MKIGLILALWAAIGVATPRGGVHMLPINCSELLPDNTPFVEFLGAVASAQADRDKSMSKRLFRILALRDQLRKGQDWTSAHNPIDALIQKTLCFFRVKKEPLKPISFESPEILKYLRGAVRELENKVEDAIFLAEFEREQRKEYERQISKNRKLIQGLEKQAQKEASSQFSRISRNARRKARSQ